MVPGGYTGRAIPGTTHPPSTLPGRGPTDSGAGPGSPAGLEWVVCGSSGVTGHGTVPVPPCGPGRGGAPPCTGTSQICPSWPIRARFHLILHKVSQNRGVSPVFIEKACPSPCLQNGLQKSALEKTRIPYSAAFSHKELMGLF